jgi:tripartite-type tricarboxylate transporter receptor subunit TctC
MPCFSPAEIVAGLNTAVRQCLANDGFRASLAKQSFEPRGCSPAELADLVKSDGEAWAATVRATGFKPMD